MTTPFLPLDLRAEGPAPGATVVVLTFSLHRCHALTRAEVAVARLAVSGLSNLAIAERRDCSVRTVANQIASALRKLGVGSRAELAAIPELFV